MALAIIDQDQTRHLDLVDVLVHPSLSTSPGDLLQQGFDAGTRVVCTSSLDAECFPAKTDSTNSAAANPPGGISVIRGVGLLPQRYTSGNVEQAVAKCLLAIKRDDVQLVSEIGLDRRAKMPALDLQMQVCLTLLKSALAHQRPVLLHAARADGPLLEVLDQCSHELGRLPAAAVHGFMGSAEHASALIRRGLFISFGPGLLNPRAKRAQKSAASVPSDRLLIESDAPTFPPAAIVAVIERLAELRNVPKREIQQQTAENARRWLGLATR